MKLEPGVYPNITCRQCGAVGTIRVGVTLRGGKVKVRDFIPHEESCAQFVRRQPRHFRRKTWRSQEKRANALVGARETLMSGAVNEDGDGRVFHGWRVESKQTQELFYRLRQATWSKLVRGALGTGEEPLLHIELDRGLNTQRRVVIRREFFDAYCDEELTHDASLKNAKSYRITASTPTPHLVDLEPVGILLLETEFRRLKEQHDGHRRAGL